MRLIVTALAASLAGCAMSTTKVADPGGAQVAILQAPPEVRAYQSRGVYAYKFYRPGMDRPTVYDVWPQLSEQVRANGGNACLMRGQDVGWISLRTITVTCDVLAVEGLP